MIKVNRPRRVPPSILSEDATGELKRARQHFSCPATRSSRFVFKVYRSADVRDAINHAFGGKCAYCESRYIGAQPGDVEHYRPKGEVSYKVGSGAKARVRKRVGYYWLACDWDNLLASCYFCNRPTKGLLADGSTTLTGKGSLFPLVDERTRARSRAALSRERPLLIDPTRESPARYLKFREDGNVDPAVATGPMFRRARATIDILGLNRRGLVEDRLRHVTLSVLPFLERYKRLLDYRDRGIADPVCLRLELDEVRSHLAEVCSDKETPFRALSRDVIAGRFAALGIPVPW